MDYLQQIHKILLIVFLFLSTYIISSLLMLYSFGCINNNDTPKTKRKNIKRQNTELLNNTRIFFCVNKKS